MRNIMQVTRASSPIIVSGTKIALLFGRKTYVFDMFAKFADRWSNQFTFPMQLSFERYNSRFNHNYPTHATLKKR